VAASDVGEVNISAFVLNTNMSTVYAVKIYSSTTFVVVVSCRRFIIRVEHMSTVYAVKIASLARVVL